MGNMTESKGSGVWGFELHCIPVSLSLLQPQDSSGSAFPEPCSPRPPPGGRAYAEPLALRICLYWLADALNPRRRALLPQIHLRYILPDYLPGRMTFEGPQEGWISR